MTGLFSFIGDAIDFVGDAIFGATDLSGQLGSAIIKTAGEFVLGGSSGQQQAAQRTPISKVAAGSVATSRVPRPSTPGPPGIADVNALHAEWLARMRRFASLAVATDTDGPRTLGTQARRT